jgi:hypothetical protein
MNENRLGRKLPKLKELPVFLDPNVEVDEYEHAQLLQDVSSDLTLLFYWRFYRNIVAGS